MIKSSGPTVIFGVNFAPDRRDFLDGTAVWVPMTPRLSVAPLPPSTVLFSPTRFVTSDVHLDLQDELDKIWRSAAAESEGTSILNYEYEFSVLFASLILWRWLVRYTIQTLEPSKVLLPKRCENVDLTPSSGSKIYELVLYKVLEEETRQVERAYFTEKEEILAPKPKTILFSLLVQNFAGFTAQVIDKARKFFLVKSLPLKFTDFRTRLTWRERLLGAFRRSHGNQVHNVLVIAQLRKVRTILRSRSAGVRMGHLSYSQFEKIINSKAGQNFSKTEYSHALSAQSFLLAHIQSLAERSRNSQEQIERFLRGNWSILVTDAQHLPQIRALIDSGTQAGKRVAAVPEGANSQSGYLERFHGPLRHDNPSVVRFVLDEALRDYWLREGTPDSSIYVSGYFGGDHPTAKRRLSVESGLLNSCLRFLPPSEKAVTVMLSFDGFFWFNELAQFGNPCMSVALSQHVKIIDELLTLGYLVLVSVRDPDVTRHLQEKFVGRSAMFTHRMPWQFLADRSDVVMVRDSSIGWQSLSGGKPVLVWNFDDYPSYMEVALDGIPNYWVHFVRSVDDIDDSITALVSQHREESIRSGLQGRLPPPVNSRSNAIRDWIHDSTPE